MNRIQWWLVRWLLRKHLKETYVDFYEGRTIATIKLQFNEKYVFTITSDNPKWVEKGDKDA
jgi:hypothetical protein